MCCYQILSQPGKPTRFKFVKASVAPDSDLEAKRVCIASNNYGEKSEYSNLQEIKS